jgi:hypothetical protein
MITRKIYVAVLIGVLISAIAHAQTMPNNYKLVYEQSFNDQNSINDFHYTQRNKWLLSKGKSGNALEFTGISDYAPPFRSPHTIGLIKNLKLGNFVLEAELLQTGKEYGHRDMCIVFGFKDPSHFYYTHIATKMDDNAHQIMLVNGAPRTKISSFTTEGIDWGQEQWHRVRVERDLNAGTIKIFFDGKLIEEANDKTFDFGSVGFGSFDDSGKIDNIKIWSDQVDNAADSFFN